MHMESPERHSIPASIGGQESPLFSFLNALSPIKPIKSVHASYVLSGFNFPSPPQVFVTPKIPVKTASKGHNLKSEQTYAGNLHNSSKDCSLLAQVEGCSMQMQGYDQSSQMFGTTKHEEDQSEHLEAEIAVACSSSTSSVCNFEDGSARAEKIIGAVNLQSSTSFHTFGIGATIVPTDGVCQHLDVDKVGEKSSTVCSSNISWCNQLHETLALVQSSPCSRPCKETIEISENDANVALVFSKVPDISNPLNETPEKWQGETSSLFSGVSFQDMVAGYKDPMNFMECGDTETDGPQKKSFRRRCLDFRISDGPVPLNSNLCSISQNMSYSSTPSMLMMTSSKHTSADSDLTGNSDLKKTSLSYHLKETGGVPPELDHQPYGLCPPSGNVTMSANMPCGIGLHLNSLTCGAPLYQSLRGENKDNEYPPMKMATEFAVASEVLSTSSSTVLRTRLQVTAINDMQKEAGIKGRMIISPTEEMNRDSCRSLPGNQKELGAYTDFSSTENSHLSGHVLYGVVEEVSKTLNHETIPAATPSCQMNINDGHDVVFRSMKKTRKRLSASDSSETGYKRCNCKKSKCLKLYCECFAAGLFCSDSCSCHDCYNKPDFEETILETRQQIESRNPLAFAPRVVQGVSQSPINGEKFSDFTPTARHKKGCSCKKSKCLKKYCECYQAGVGCSESCRCESCQNLYGRKEEGSEEVAGRDAHAESLEKIAMEEDIDVSTFCSNFSHILEYQCDDMSPAQSSLQSARQLIGWPSPWTSSSNLFNTLKD
ncbi:hypothetical protein KP509_37G022000 [Ceratopteris richardii]|uniref:CRC domain-containing protein n=1 Tax=Ceratopteris richardii TaxID=49495 RepID=A0A8T2Q791_CERRI|nr:hypothetical protein KP509_37G022000 [Ceratopteris richardii]